MSKFEQTKITLRSRLDDLDSKTEKKIKESNNFNQLGFHKLSQIRLDEVSKLRKLMVKVRVELDWIMKIK